MNAPSIEAALADIHQRLLELGRRFALLGGLAVLAASRWAHRRHVQRYFTDCADELRNNPYFDT